MMVHDDDRSVSSLLTDAFKQLSLLVRSEVNLVQAEMTAKAKRAAVGAGLVVGAALVVLPAFVLLLMALAALLTTVGVPEPLSDFIAALVGFGIAGLLAAIGIGRLRADTMAPTRTITQLQRDATAAKEHLS